MSYTSGGIIQSSDFNNMTSTVNNTLSSHYGQGPLTSFVTSSNTVSAYVTNSLVTSSNMLINHQGLNGRTLSTSVAQGSNITTSNIQSNVNTLNPYRFYAASNSTVQAAYVQTGYQWSNDMDHRFTVTGGNLDYFFNSGGQIKLSFYHPYNTSWDGLFSNLATRCGTIVISAASGATIAGSSYNGVTKIGGSGSPAALYNDRGWYNLNGSWQGLFTQYASDIPGGMSLAYASTYLQVSAYKSGNNLYFQVLYDEAPNGVTMSAGTTSYIYIASPSTTYINNSWGTVTASGYNFADLWG